MEDVVNAPDTQKTGFFRDRWAFAVFLILILLLFSWD